MKNHQEKGFPGLEALRFLASATIVIYHYSWYFAKRFLFKGYLAVDLFFVLSGFVIAFAYHARIDSWQLYWVFLRKRFARLYPLHALTLGLYVSLALAGTMGLVKVISPDKYQFSALISNALLTHAWGLAHGDSFNTVSWSISAELGAYLLFPLLWRAVRGHWSSGFLAVSAVYAFGILFAWKMFHKPLMGLSWNFGVLRALAGFSFGLWLFAHLGRSSRLLAGNVAISGFYLCLAGWIGSMAFSFNDYIGAGFAAGLVWFTAIADTKGLAHRICQSWMSNHGELTYSIYMIHPLMATAVISGIGPRIFGRGLTGIGFSIAAALIITYSLSRLSYVYFEEPARRWLGGSRPRHLGPEESAKSEQWPIPLSNPPRGTSL